MFAPVNGSSILSWTLALATLSTSACKITYYGQAARGQMEIWSKQRPVAALLAAPTTDPELKDRLHLVADILAFAESELLLPAGGSYATYADLGRDAVLWSVFAAPPLSVEPVTWHYPVAGKLDYRGYFVERRAEEFAARLRKKGLDVAVAPVPAYSTLGWFKDPLLNTFIEESPALVAGLLFHELAHRKYYRPGDTSFSEAFAVAVEREGALRWLQSRGDAKELALHRRRLAAIDSFTSRILETRAELEALYSLPLPDEEKLRRKAEVLAALQVHVRHAISRAGESAANRFWLRDDLNHAHLNAISAYYLRVPEFERLLADCGGDLARFYEAAAALP